MEPRISILLPVFNAAPFLRACLDSLLSQTLADFEVIAVDDGSGDESPAILREYEKKDPRIRAHAMEHSGIVAALQAAFQRSTGEYLARMDADDLCDPKRFERQLHLLNHRTDIAVASCLAAPIPGQILSGGYRLYLDWINSLVEPDQIALNMFVESPMPHPSVMIRREAYEKAGGYRDRGWPEDYDLWLRMHLAGRRFAKVPEPLLFWRDYPDRHSRKDPRYGMDSFYRAKAHYLARGPLKHVREVIVWGAGRTTRSRAAHLAGHGISIIAYVDIDPKKIGHTIAGAPVIPPEGLADYPDRIVLPFVASWGARQDIRARLAAMNKTEGADFICCA